MLIKNELMNLPLTPGPKAKKKCSFTAGIATFTPKRCGEILAIDVYEKSKLQFRFFTDGKNYITLVGQLDMGLEPGSWTRRNPFLSFPALHTGVAIKSGAEDIVCSVIKAASISTRDDSFIINTVCSFISDIAWEKKRKTWEAKMTLMEKHLAMLPKYPADLEKYCEYNVFTDSVVYISKLEKGKRWGSCRHCGKCFPLDRSTKTGSVGVCPKCGTPVLFRGQWVKGEITHKAKICIAQKAKGQLILRYVDIVRTISADSVRPDYEFSDYFLNIYPAGTPSGKCYAYYYYWWPYYVRGWSRLKNGEECYDTTHVYTRNLRRVFGSQYCNVDLAAGLKGIHRLLKFRNLLDNLWASPQAEYLFKTGLPILAAEPSLRNKSGNTFTELFGVSKQYLPILRETQANMQEIDVISAAERWVPEDTVRQLCARNMDSYTLHTLSETTQYNSLGRVLRYLNKQYAQAAGALKKRKKDYFVTLYRDYLNCASELKSDMKKRGVLEPKDLKFQHDLLTARVNEQKEEEQQKELNKPIDQSIYWWAQAYANKDYTVVYPQTRLDFLTEGQCLNHCVGSSRYYEQHVKGQQMVFFIRRTGQPNKPYFTAEIDVESGRIRQLYGFGDCSAPKEVRAFVEGFVKAVSRWRNVQAIAS